jgi:alpha-glucosidase
MQWSAEPGAGFTEAGVRPWLPIGDAANCNVAAQRQDRGSSLHLTRDLIALRAAEPDLRGGGYETLPAPDGAWAWRRGEGHAVALNLSDTEVTVQDLQGRVAIATERARDGEQVEGSLVLGPWQGAVIALEP